MTIRSVKIFIRSTLCLTLLCLSLSVKAQLAAHAGSDQYICPGVSVTIGGSPAATGGFPPYTYSWSPGSGLSSTTIMNPTATPSSDASYTLTVTDDSNNVATDVVSITYSYIKYVNAGPDINICEFGFGAIGGPDNNTGTGVTYSWSPGNTLNDSTLPQPTAFPPGTTTYTLTASIAGCPGKTDQVTVTVIPTPPINAGNDTTIQEGATATLHGSGGFSYAWSPTNTLTYIYSPNPDAEPIVTTTYYLYGTDKTKQCPGYDSVTVFVEPSNDVVFYNTFTPNGDGNNDTWYIGNIYKYPDNRLEIYNRYGKLVYRTTGYLNTWDGKAFGQELPSATYFYVMDLGNDMGIFHGTVTIIR